jgi:hypothetical protein
VIREVRGRTRLHTSLIDGCMKQSIAILLTRMKDRGARALCYVAVVALLGAVGAVPATAEAKRTQLQLHHQPPPAKSIPFPGQELTLEVTVLNSKKIDNRLRVLAVHDGKLVDFSLTEGSADLQDRAHYSVKLPAPISELNYQFVLYGANDTVSVSPRYSLRRPCEPDLRSTVIEREPNDNSSEQIRLAKIARSLEREIKAYEFAVRVLEELERSLSEAP